VTPGAAPGPVLETARLVLRPHALADFDDCFALWSDPETVRFIGGRPSSEPEVWARLMRYGGFWTLLGYGFWVARERDGGRFVGEIGFLNARRGLGPRFSGAPEMGWVLSPAFQGRGLAGEAAGAALAWADERWPRTVCLIESENGPSIRLAERQGFRAFEETRLEGDPIILFERLRPA
jgi:RimJ/RimL family protein N-acetyltransferase